MDTLSPRPLTVQDLLPASVLLAGGLFLGSLAPEFPLVVGGLVLGPLFLFLIAGSRRLFLFLFLGIACAGGMLLTSPGGRVSPFSSPAVFSLCLESSPTLTKHGAIAPLANDGSAPDLPRSFRLFIPSGRLSGTIEAGDCLSGIATAPSRPFSPVFFGDPRPLYFLSADAPLTVTRTTSPRQNFLRALHKVQKELLDHLMSTFPPDTAGLLAALLLSDTRFMTEAENQDFTNAGVSHLLSVSGEHMTLLALFLGGAGLLTLRLLPLSLLRRLLLHLPVRRTLPLTILPLLLSYTLMIGAPEAADRAFVGFALVAIFRLAFVDLDFSTILGLSTILMLIFSPRLATSLSFLLSLLALWGIVLAARKASASSNILNQARGLSPLRTGAVVTLLTAPLVAAVFRTINPEALVDNLLVVPLAGDLLLPLGAGELLFHLLKPDPLALVSLSITSLSHAVLGLVHALARFPGASFSLPPPNPLLIALFYLVASGLLLSPKVSLKKTGIPLVAIFLLSLILPSPHRADILRPAIERGEGVRFRYDPAKERHNIAGLLPEIHVASR